MSHLAWLTKYSQLLPALLLVACNHSSPPRPPSPAAFSSTAVIPVTATADRGALERSLGARVLVWRPEAGFAVIGLAHAASGHLRPLDLDGVSDVEENGGALEAGGAVSAWSETGVNGSGRAYMWSGGRAYMWSGGNGVVGGLTENAGAWRQVQLDQAWAVALALGQGVKVAVIDTGLDLQHEAFQGSLVPQEDRWDFVDNDAVPQDAGGFTDAAFGHGTNVAGIILQVAPRAQIMPLRVLRPDGSGDVTAVAQAIDWAVAHGAQIINLSLGSVKKTGVLKRMIKYATEQGVYVVASSGNSGNKSITYPARYGHDGGALGDLSLSVGSVDASDHKSSFSTYGKELEVVAPGERVYGPVPGNLLSYWSGTSMASPMVSGALALALGQSLAVPRDALAQTLEKSGDDINGLNDPYKNEVGRRLNIGLFIKSVVRR